MASRQEPRSLVYYDWDNGEDGWKSQMDGNLSKLGTFVGLSAIDKDLTGPPGSPSDGDAYIVAATATGAWINQEDNIVVWRDHLSTWEVYDISTFRARLLCFIEDENRLVVWNGTNWNLGVTLT